MTFLKTLLLAATLSVASTAETTCPAGWLLNTWTVTRCCSGTMVVDEQGAYCCVTDMRAYKEALTNTALLYETATTTSDTNWSTVENSCVAEVRFTATDYSAQVSSAASKAEATTTNDSTSEVTSTSTTASGASSGAGSQTSTSIPTATSTATSGSASASTPTSTSTTTSTSNAAMPLVTGEGLVLGGAAFAAALFML
ncbi:hypothetical protein DTO006G1_9929 [Penicillium roqueforti]|nr:hypothetical protein DTO006G1_9929 [Penicillium roqueforti]KAI3250959.1 hypothetical protein DTO006G7_8227 [Penicillium roqueforti]